jgi:DNA-binding NtrC family response regulator
VPRVLFVDDERDITTALSRWFARRGFDTASADGTTGAVALLEQASAPGGVRFDAVCTDLSMPDGDGLQVLRAVRRLLPGTPVLLLTAYASIPTAVEAMRLGAVTLLEKPAEMELLERELRAAIGDSRELSSGLQAASAAGLIGEAPALRDLLDAIVRVAPTNSSVLLAGESGTGKELVAQAIHRLSRRAQGPLVAVNCAALPESLLESELFGHEKGAFTGATSSRPGRFRAAEGGTLFLDEIGELPLSLQAKLLRVLQDHAVLSVGSTQAQPVDFRLVTASNRDLELMVERGGFRADLFYRLNVVPLALPPLRERPGDVALLFRHFLQRAGSRLELTSDALAALESWRWPGNVRELENLAERLTVLHGDRTVARAQLPEPYRSSSGSGLRAVRALRSSPGGAAAAQAGPITPDPAPAQRPPPQTTPSAQALPVAQPDPARPVSWPPQSGPLPAQGIDLPAVLAELEERLIQEALERTGGNKNQAARFLGLNRTTLVEKLRKRARVAADRSAAAQTGGFPDPTEGEKES